MQYTLNPNPLDPALDEVTIHRGALGEETVAVFASQCMSRANALRLRSVFADPDGQISSQVSVVQDRARPIVLVIERSGKAPFEFSSPALLPGGQSSATRRRRGR